MEGYAEYFLEDREKVDMMKIKPFIHFLGHHNRHQIINMVKYKLSKPSHILNYRPINLGVYITNRCTLACRTCPYLDDSNPYRPEPYEDMSFDRFKVILAKFREVVSVTLTGEGEPFLNKDIFRMIDYATNEHKMRITMSTNATNIEDKIEKIVASPISTLNMSLDGITFEKYKEIRGGNRDTYNKVVRNMKELIKKRNELKSQLRIEISHIMNVNNYKEIPEIIKFVEDIGGDVVHFQNTIAFGTQLSQEKLSLFNNPEIVRFMKDVGSSSKIDIILPTLFTRGGIARMCSQPFTSIGINTRGDVNPCCYLGTNEKYGNIFKEKDVWNNKQFQEIRSKIINGEMPFQLCRHCGSIYKPGRVIPKST